MERMHSTILSRIKKGYEIMKKLMELVTKKSRIEYDINSIEKYIKDGDYDGSLKRTWDIYVKELEELNSEIDLLSNPKTQEIELKRIELLESISAHEREIELLKSQVAELEDKLHQV